jgi:branched-chain amino acid transport system substrate-binding protein
MRKTWLAVMSALFLVAIIFSTPLPSWAQAKGPIKIGYITPLTGPMVSNGRDTLAGFQLYLEEIGYQVAGRKIEFIVEDDEASLPQADEDEKTGEKDGVHLMSGGLMASTGYAIAPYIDEAQIPMTYPIMAPDDLTQRQRPKWIVRTGWTSSQVNHPLGEYAYQTLKYRKVAVIGLDFAFGWESVGGFHKTFEEAGGKIMKSGVFNGHRLQLCPDLTTRMVYALMAAAPPSLSSS